MKRYVVFFSLLMFLPNNAWAFDRIYCQADLNGWIVTLTESTQSAVLTPHNQNATLTEQVSQKLILKDINANTVITVFPWNSLYIRIPESTKKKYRVDSKESPFGFLIEISDKIGNVTRSLNCRFTF